MRWTRVEYRGRERLGFITGDRVQLVHAERLSDVIADGEVNEDGEPVDWSELQQRAPITPGKIIATGNNYHDHCREQGIDPPDRPVLFPKFANGIVGSGEPVRWPEDLTQQVDYEVELGVIMGERAYRISEEAALDHVFGYTAVNDISARDLQMNDGQWLRGKALDTFCPVGPVVVTADELPRPQDLSLRSWVNGKLMQDSHTGEMIFPVASLLAFITCGITLEPGDLVLTGTPHGVGYFRRPQVFLQPGDTVEVEVGDFGRLTNPVVSGP